MKKLDDLQHLAGIHDRRFDKPEVPTNPKTEVIVPTDKGVLRMRALAGVDPRRMWEATPTMPKKEYVSGSGNKSTAGIRSQGTGSGEEYEEPEPDGEAETDDESDKVATKKAIKAYNKKKDKEDKDEEEAEAEASVSECLGSLLDEARYRLGVMMLEASMSAAEAQKILELPAGWSKGDLKRAFQGMALKHHPDTGGDLATMKSVNAAYNVLKDVIPASVKADYKQQYAQQKEKNKEIVVSTVNGLFDPKKYAEYFHNKTGKVFSFKVDDSFTSNYFYKNVEWRSSDNDTVFSIQIAVSIIDVKTTKSLGGGEPTLAFSVILHPTVLHNNRKSKMRQKNWEFSSKQSSLVDPTKVFPVASIKKMMAGKDKDRKFSRRDMVTAIERGMKGRTETSGGSLWAYIPMGDYQLNLFRSVMMKSATWAVHSVHAKVDGKRKTFKPHKFSLTSETEDTVQALKNLQKHRWNDPQALADAASLAFNALNKKGEAEEACCDACAKDDKRKCKKLMTRMESLLVR
jgi:hypothetical protein